MKTSRKKVLFLSNYAKGYVLTTRCECFAAACESFAESRIESRQKSRRVSIFHYLITVMKYKPDLIYTMEGFSGEFVALLMKILFGIPYIVDRANTNEDYFRESGYSYFYWKPIAIFERLLLALASGVATRGLNQTLVFRARFYNKNIVHLSEGTDLKNWRPLDGKALRTKYDVSDALVLGVIGTAQWSDVSGHYSGREMLEVIRLLPHRNIVAINLPSITSDESALVSLERMATSYGIESKLRIIRGVAREDVPKYLAMMDVCISTQLNSLSGEMRTTAKLPDYMACGKYIISSSIGDAKFYLPPSALVTQDEYYYSSLAKKVDYIFDDMSELAKGKQYVDIAHQHFSYEVIASKASEMIRKVISE